MDEILPTLDDITLLARGVWPAATFSAAAILVPKAWLRSLVAALVPAVILVGVRTMTHDWPSPANVTSADQRMLWSGVYWAVLVGGLAAFASRGDADRKPGLPTVLLCSVVLPLAGLLGALAWVLHPFLDRSPGDPTAVAWLDIGIAALVLMAVGMVAAAGIRWPAGSGGDAAGSRWDLRRGAAPFAWHIALSALGMLLVMYRTASLGQLLAGLGMVTAATAVFSLLLPGRRGIAPVHGAVLVGTAGIIVVGCRPLLDPAPSWLAIAICALSGAAPLLLRIPALDRKPGWLGALVVLVVASAVAIAGLAVGYQDMPEADPYGYGR